MTFLGDSGRSNDVDVIDIIVKRPACARFVARHLYNFFVADEVPVPAWQNIPPQDPDAVRILEQAFVAGNYDIRSALRALFNSDFFKNARFAKVKSPAELVIGLARLVDDFKEPKPAYADLNHEMRYIGMDLLNPPTVEGWHTGKEWIDTGTLVERINFAANYLGDSSLPGVKSIISRIASQDTMSPEQFVERCLDLVGQIDISDDSRKILVERSRSGGPLVSATEGERPAFSRRVLEMLQLITATQEYQFC